MPTLLLDGVRLAAERAQHLAARASAHRLRTGRNATLALIAFETTPGYAPHVERKRRAFETTGVELQTHVLPERVDTNRVRTVIHDAGADPAVDAVFVQFPLPASVDAGGVFASIPVAKDIDVLHPDSFSSFLERDDVEPPVTVTAALLLLDRYRIAVAGKKALMIGAESPLVRAFEIALERRGAYVLPRTEPRDTTLTERLGSADIVVAAVGEPAAVRSDALRAGTVAIDVGYFNAGGRGDIDTAGGTSHLAALAPVPGGIGPMTVSALIERTLDLAERAATATRSTHR